MHRPLTILVTGPPAAGKSTVRGFLRPLLDKLLDEYVDLGIDEVLRSMYSRGELHDAEIRANNALILHKPEIDVPAALGNLAQQREMFDGPALIEIPLLDDWLWSFLERTAQDQLELLVILLNAPLDVRVNRNALRGDGQISEENLIQMASLLEPRVAAKLLATARGVLSIDTRADRHRLGRIVAGWVEASIS